MSILTVFDYESQGIRFEKRGDRVWVNLNDMAKASGKRIDHWKVNAQTIEFLTALEHSLESRVMVSNVGGKPETTGTWAIEEVAIEFAGWCSVKFKIWCNRQIKTLMETGKVELSKMSAEDLVTKFGLPGDYEEALEHLLGQVRINKELQAANAELTAHNQIMAETIDMNAPKVAFANQVEFSQNAVSIGDYAKIIGTGRNRLFAKLRDLKIIQQKPSTIPYQRFVDQGYFEVGETAIIHNNGEVEMKPYSKITGKGQVWLYRKLRHNQQVEMAAIAGISKAVADMTLL